MSHRCLGHHHCLPTRALAASTLASSLCWPSPTCVHWGLLLAFQYFRPSLVVYGNLAARLWSRREHCHHETVYRLEDLEGAIARSLASAVKHGCHRAVLQCSVAHRQKSNTDNTRELLECKKHNVSLWGAYPCSPLMHRCGCLSQIWPVHRDPGMPSARRSPPREAS